MSEMMGKLNTILADSVILDLNLGIAALGRDVESLLGVSSEELTGEQFADVCVEGDLRERLQTRLKSGYFVDLDANLWIRGGEPCRVSLSGFYLGLISDINGYIILKIKLKEDNSTLKKELFTKKRELDTFIYRTAHDLRGPLATIKGLVNLLKIRKTDLEVDKLTNLIEVHADKLDDRLFKLLYIANDNDHYDPGTGCIDFHVLKESLIKTLKDNCQLDKAIIDFQAPTSDLCQVNDRAISRLLRHALLYIIGLPVASAAEGDQLEIGVDVQVTEGNLGITFNAKGFVASEQIRKVIEKPTSLYSDLLTHPLLFNYYVTCKEAMSLSASIHVIFFGATHQVIDITIPISPKTLYKHIDN
jgi:signal transduction histidine kinase